MSDKPSNDAEWFDWLVESRARNQGACAKLYRLIKRLPSGSEKSELSYESNTLLAIGFSLWRALFLANRDRFATKTREHAIYFLETMIETNAIAFTQDCKAKNFTFNYYMANARYRFKEYAEKNSDFPVDPSLLEIGSELGPKERWTAFQKVFDAVVGHFEKKLQ